MLSFACRNLGRLHSLVMFELSLKRIVGSEEEGQQHSTLAVTSVSVQLQGDIQAREVKTDSGRLERGGGQVLMILV